jgi:hypothetical protein
VVKQKHCYLFAFEVTPLHVGAVYDELPLHCTLMHRFWSKLSPEDLANRVRSFFEHVHPVTLTAEKQLLLGPKQTPVTELELTDELRKLHMELYEFLNSLPVEYTAPEYVGGGYRAHVSERPHDRLEVRVPRDERKRFVRAKFNLG